MAALKLVTKGCTDGVGAKSSRGLDNMEIRVIGRQVPSSPNEIVFQEQLSCGRAVQVAKRFDAAVTQVLSTIDFADAEADARCGQVAVVLRRAEVTVIRVAGVMKVTKRVAAGDGKAAVGPAKPPHRLCPFTLIAITVRVMRKVEASGKREIARTIIDPAMPAFRQKIELSSVPGGQNGIA